MDLKFSSSDFPGITDPVIYRAYESSAPTTMVADSGVINPPHSAPRNIVIANVNPIPHIVRCYQLPTGATIGILRKEFWIDPTFFNYNGEEVRFYVVDGGLTNDPVAGVRAIVDPYLDNKRYTVELRNEGTMIYEEGLNVRDEYTRTVGGGFEISDINYAFQADQVICVRIQARVSSAVPVATSTSIFQDLLQLSTSAVLGAGAATDWLKKLIDIVSDTAQFELELETIALVPDNTIIHILSNQGSQINPVIKCKPGEKIIWNRGQVDQVYMGICEYLVLVKQGSVYRVLSMSDSAYRVGTRCSTLAYNTVFIPNTIKPNGQLLLRADYPRLFYFLQINPDLLCPEANWNDTSTIVDGMSSTVATRYKNHGFFTLGDGVTNFRVPKWAKAFFRTLDYDNPTSDATRITQGAGGFQHGDLMPHRHKLFNGDIGGSGNPLTNVRIPNVQRDTDADYKYSIVGNATEPTLGYSGRGESGTSETRPENFAEYSLLYI